MADNTTFSTCQQRDLLAMAALLATAAPCGAPGPAGARHGEGGDSGPVLSGPPLRPSSAPAPPPK